MLDIRLYQQGDSPHLLNIDLKGCEFPYSIKEWQALNKFFPNWNVLVGVLDKQPVAFLIENLEEASIEKLAAIPQYFGVLNFLLDVASFRAKQNKLECILPDIECRGPNDAHDKGQLLLSNGFRCEETIENCFEAYGKLVDGLVFRKLLGD